MTERVIGLHDGCGGDVLYVSTPREGWRLCLKCGANSRKRDTVLLKSEAIRLGLTTSPR
jgi:hypothetical protein